MSASSRFITYVFFLGLMQARFLLVHGDCWYDSKKHEENSEVPTGEPCLNCTCSKSVLLCYLRVCPKLPNPPPPGCILLHRYRTCCPELICSDFYDGGNSLEARADLDGDLDFPSDDQSAYENACISNGSIYGPGSAMHSSSMCEYCYCLGGKQVCVKPKCLLPLEGCSPIFEGSSCCPERYNCSRLSLPESVTQKSTTTTQKPISTNLIEGGCVVEGTNYPEGSKVIGVGHSVCDNCYCLRSLLRCEPLSCAPPLLGCTPIVKEGECCAASYNCNGSLEIEPEPNYGLFPTISKEYSKLRKEVQRKPSSKPFYKTQDGPVTVAPFYVLAETLQEPTTKLIYERSPETYGTTRQFSGTNIKTSTTQESLKPKESNYFLISSSKQQRSTTSARPVMPQRTAPIDHKKIVYTTTTEKLKFSSTEKVPEIKEDSNDYLGFSGFNILSIVDSLLDGKFHRKVENATKTMFKNQTNFSNFSKKTSESLDLSQSNDTGFVQISTSTVNDITSEATTADDTRSSTISDDVTITSKLLYEANDITTTTEINDNIVTVTSIMNSTDCINSDEQNIAKESQDIETTTVPPIDPEEINNLLESKTELFSTTDSNFADSENLSTEESSNYFHIKSRNKVKTGASKLPPDIEAILNITRNKNGDDFDYDYNKPTLPPSLPNLQIIPFLAADALDSSKESPKDPSIATVEEKIDKIPLEYSTNIFRPPVETEGGFVPKNPVVDYFYNSLSSIPSITSESYENGNVINCIFDGQEIQHGLSVPSNSPCMTCTCFYGNVACQKIDCPPPKAGCKIVVEQVIALCCPNYICDDDMDISKIPPEIITVAEGIIPIDPFKDVIKTETAPNLQSLIGDRISLEQTTISPLSTIKDSSTSPTSTTQSDIADYDNSLGFHEILHFIFSGKPDVIEKPPSTNPSKPKNQSEIVRVEAVSANQNNSNVNLVESSKLPNTITTTSSYFINKLVENSNNLTSSLNADLPKHEKLTSIKETFNKLLNATEPSNKTGDVKNMNSIGVGLVLAGCNIYGRMYRVGRIISELSGPCLECKCTEIGVQCRQLKCLNNNKSLN